MSGIRLSLAEKIQQIMENEGISDISSTSDRKDSEDVMMDVHGYGNTQHRGSYNDDDYLDSEWSGISPPMTPADQSGSIQDEDYSNHEINNVQDDEKLEEDESWDLPHQEKEKQQSMISQRVIIQTPSPSHKKPQKSNNPRADSIRPTPPRPPIANSEVAEIDPNVEIAMQKLIDELREAKLETQKIESTLDQRIDKAVKAAKAAIDQDYRIVIKSLVSEHKKSMKMMELRLAEAHKEVEKERYRCNMLVEDLESREFNNAQMPANNIISNRINRRSPTQTSPSMVGKTLKSKSSMVPQATRRSATPSARRINMEITSHTVHQPQPHQELVSSTRKYRVYKDPDTSQEDMLGRSSVHAVTTRIYASLQQPDKINKPVPATRVRMFLRMSDIVPANMKTASLDVILSKHSKKTGHVTVYQLEDILVDLSIVLLEYNILSIPPSQTIVENIPQHWTADASIAHVTRKDVLDALFRYIVPN